MMVDKPVTKAMWTNIADELKGYFCHVRFRYQDTVVSITRERDGESRTVLAVYFDGKMCAGWGSEASDMFNPLTRLFWCEKRRRYYSAKRVAELEKLFGKRKAKAMFPELHDCMRYRTPFFNSSAALIRQFRKADGLTIITEQEA
ncbi:hypothetical protein DT73_12775 [Mangrovibacter sp. MFB070]|uniref:hypothetical protein n=1 Tax=Mangrovibacter sp. MFB070 TaxID=1224318 RepID=UPI0004D7B20F|nr:hypothetical protein [Mangrovibacter sp. MFB070]KEA51803.1 hypothetical protein DT73_12775 [Mangrovibacter sp. MFB070]